MTRVAGKQQAKVVPNLRRLGLKTFRDAHSHTACIIAQSNRRFTVGKRAVDLWKYAWQTQFAFCRLFLLCAFDFELDLPRRLVRALARATS
jgi:hypothetical protein